MTVTEILKRLGAQLSDGAHGVLLCDMIWVPVLIHDAREAWGRLDVLVSPTGGAGRQWVSLERIRRVPRNGSEGSVGSHVSSRRG
jgi:hypothetical protein